MSPEPTILPCKECGQPRTVRDPRAPADSPAVTLCPDHFRHIAGHQADTIRQQGQRIRELIAERDAATARTEGIADLVAQYARRLGIDLPADSAVRYAEEYWRLRALWDKDFESLEAFRMHMLYCVRQLEENDFGPADDLAKRVAAAIAAANPVGGGNPRAKAADLHPRPALPSQPTLDGEAA